MQRRAVVLLSGGIDSAAALAQVVTEGYDVHTLTLDYAQANRSEIDSAEHLAGVLGVSEHLVLHSDLGDSLDWPVRPRSGPNPLSESHATNSLPYAFARDNVLIAMGIAWAASLRAETVVLGSSRDRYLGLRSVLGEVGDAYDRVAAATTSETGQTSRVCRVAFPQVGQSRASILEACARLEVPISRTVSCDTAPEAERCGRCPGCLLRAGHE